MAILTCIPLLELVNTCTNSKNNLFMDFNLQQNREDAAINNLSLGDCLETKTILEHHFCNRCGGGGC